MKRFRLISACLSCFLCLSVLIVSVYAAVNAVYFNLSASLVFEPNNCYVEINGDVSGEGTNGYEPFYTLTDGTNPYPEWNIERLILLNEVSLNFTFTNYSNFPIKITIFGVSSGTNYTATLSKSELVINAYQQGETPYSDNLTITYKLIDQAESVNLTNLNIAINIEETTPTPPEGATDLELYMFYHPDATLPSGLINNIDNINGDTLTEIITSMGYDSRTVTLISYIESNGTFSEYDIGKIRNMLCDMILIFDDLGVGAGSPLSNIQADVLIALQDLINEIYAMLGVTIKINSNGQVQITPPGSALTDGFFLLTDLN